jgi:ribonuclease P protein component
MDGRMVVVDFGAGGGIIALMSEGFRFPAKQRLSRKRDFDRVFENGRSAADGNLVVYVFATENGFPRLGMAVGKRHGGAVERNRIKRLIREAFRLNRAELPASADIVVVPRSGMRAELGEIAGSLISLTKIAAGKKD